MLAVACAGRFDSRAPCTMLLVVPTSPPGELCEDKTPLTADLGGEMMNTIPMSKPPLRKAWPRIFFNQKVLLAASSPSDNSSPPYAS